MLLSLEILSWIPMTLYVLAALPQAWTNMRLRSTQGLSMLMIFIRFSTGLFYNTYINLCGLPLSYRVMMFLYTLSFSVLVVQGYRYSSQAMQKVLKRGYASIVSLLLISLVVALWYPYQVGYMIGTCAVTASVFTDLPQVIKNYRRKTMKGFSFYFATLLGLGAILELCIALWFSLPFPTVFSAARAASYSFVFWAQFFLYRNKRLQSAS